MKIAIPQELINQYVLVGGIYDSTITNVTTKFVKDLPKEFVGKSIEEVSDEYKYLNVEHTLTNGQKVWEIISLKASAMWKLVQLLVHLKMNLEEISKKGFNPSTLIGKKDKVQVEVEEYNGKQTLKIVNHLS